jgi:hypothetical protein
LPQLGQPPAEVVEAPGRQLLEPAVVLVAAEDGGHRRERLEHQVQVLAGKLGNGVSHGHTLLSGMEACTRAPTTTKRCSSISQVPFL